MVGTLYYSWEIGNALKGLRLSALYGTDGGWNLLNGGPGFDRCRLDPEGRRVRCER